MRIGYGRWSNCRPLHGSATRSRAALRNRLWLVTPQSSFGQSPWLNALAEDWARGGSRMGPEDMPVQSTPKEVDPGDVALLPPENEIYEDIYQRVLGEVRARIDQRIADIEAQAAPELVEAGELELVDAEHAGAPQAPRRRPLLRAAITLAASAGLIGAVVTLARDHTEAITSVTDRIDAAVQAIRASPPKAASTGASEMTMGASNAPDALQAAPASPPSASPSPADAATAPSSDPSSAMAEAPPERDNPSAPDRDLAPLIEKIAHDVAELQVGLQGLKTSQEQASRDQAKAIEQLQAGQDQLARAVRAARNEAPAAAAPRLTPRPPPGRPPRFP